MPKAPLLVMLAILVTQIASADTVFVKSLAENAADCQPGYPAPPPTCVKSREVVKELNKQLDKSKQFTVATSEDGADLAVEVMLVLEGSGKYAVQDNSVSVGNTTIVDFDVREIKVKQILTTVYRGNDIEQMFRAKSVKDLRKKLEKMYRD